MKLAIQNKTIIYKCCSYTFFKFDKAKIHWCKTTANKNRDFRIAALFLHFISSTESRYWFRLFASHMASLVIYWSSPCCSLIFNKCSNFKSSLNC